MTYKKKVKELKLSKDEKEIITKYKNKINKKKEEEEEETKKPLEPIKRKKISELFAFKKKKPDIKLITCKDGTVKEIAVKNIKNKKTLKELAAINNRRRMSKALARSYLVQWEELMALSGIVNKHGVTYSPQEINVTGYGFYTDIYCPPTLTYEKLMSEETTKLFESAFLKYSKDGNHKSCTVIMVKERRSPLVHAEFIFEEPSRANYKPVFCKANGEPIKPYEVFIGYKYNGDPIVVSMINIPHILISGGTRSGKSKMVDIIITNGVMNSTPEELNLYLLQGAKDDMIVYADLPHTKAYCTELDEMIDCLNDVQNEITRRILLFKDLRRADEICNYVEFNEYYKDNPEMHVPIICVITDEAGSIFNKSGDDKDTKEKKTIIERHLMDICQYGASLGIYDLTALQRPNKENLNTFIKANSTLNVSFRQNNEVSSQVATDHSKLALGLQQREFWYTVQLESGYGYVPWIPSKHLKQFLDPLKEPVIKARKEEEERRIAEVKEEEERERRAKEELESMNRKDLESMNDSIEISNKKSKEEMIDITTESKQILGALNNKDVKEEIKKEICNSVYIATLPNPKPNPKPKNYSNKGKAFSIPKEENDEEKLKKGIANINNFVPYNPSIKIIEDVIDDNIFNCEYEEDNNLNSEDKEGEE